MATSDLTIRPVFEENWLSGMLISTDYLLLHSHDQKPRQTLTSLFIRFPFRLLTSWHTLISAHSKLLLIAPVP